MEPSPRGALRRLAQLLGIQTQFTDATGRRRSVPQETVIAVARLLGAELNDLGEAPAALRAALAERWRQPLDPVCVAWQGRPATLRRRGPQPTIAAGTRVTLTLEDGSRHAWDSGQLELVDERPGEVDGAAYVEEARRIPLDLPPGYHTLSLDGAGGAASSQVIAAPREMYRSPAADEGRRWGVFLPLYALHSDRSWGAGNYTDLGDLAAWAAGQGAAFVATLPLVACRVEDRDGISPYAPSSRLFWNELFLDVPRVIERWGGPRSRARLGSSDVAARIAALRQLPLVDYPAQAALQRELLELAAADFFSGSSPERAAFETALGARPELADFARFRVAERQQGPGWQQWPAAWSDGQIGADVLPAAEVRFAAWTQWLAGEQLAEAAARMETAGATCYLDLPLGVAGDGYDVWRHRANFALGAAGGAPPDGFFTQGQNWGFPPLSPRALRDDRYDYWRRVLRHHLRHARLLRIDHVMGLHRLFWIPQGLPTAAGAYVHYPADELYAILALESHRAQTELVGENLGTVPPVVHQALAAHRLRPTYVAQFSFRPDPQRALSAPPRSAMAGLNTHDMPTWAAFCQALDVDDRCDLGLIDEPEAQELRVARAELRRVLGEFLRCRGLLDADAEANTEADAEAHAETPRTLLAGLMRFLGRQRVELLVVALEDLWLETAPQNVPGTHRERPNWQRRARMSFEDFAQSPEIAELLALWRSRAPSE